MLTPGKLYVDSPVQLTIMFRDDDGVLVDPDTVTFKTRSPCGVTRSYVYGTDDEVMRTSAGVYAADVTPDESGRWRYRWETTEPAFGTESDFLIQESAFASNVDTCDYV